VWVNVTNIPAGGSSVIRMWYGNEKAAGVSNVNATFKRVIDNGQPLVGSWNLMNGLERPLMIVLEMGMMELF